MRKFSIILLTVLLVGAGAYYLVQSLGTAVGGGGSEQVVPDSVVSGESATVRLIVNAWGGGGPIQGRFTELRLNYRLEGETAFRTVTPKLITLPENYQRAVTENNQWEAYEFTIPSHRTESKKAIEYNIEYVFDGYPVRHDGIKKIQII